MAPWTIFTTCLSHCSLASSRCRFAVAFMTRRSVALPISSVGTSTAEFAAYTTANHTAAPAAIHATARHQVPPYPRTRSHPPTAPLAARAPTRHLPHPATAVPATSSVPCARHLPALQPHRPHAPPHGTRRHRLPTQYRHHDTFPLSLLPHARNARLPGLLGRPARGY